MTQEPSFLTLEDILLIHQKEIQLSGGVADVRDHEGVKACVDSPKASYGGQYLYDMFEMAANYITCISIRHPFLDGNKRTALASALTFLYLNGYKIDETYDVELADLVLDFITKKIDKEGVAKHLRDNSQKF